MGVHGLRSYDAVQLATAVPVADAVPVGIDFLAYDGTLSAAAAAQGLTAPAIHR